ncbi:DUF3450 domain-containing protein [bacterium]|nr:DUF3450 domain-containing protein [bacterium]
MKIPKKLKDEIWEYCRLNDITDIDAFILKSTQQGFNIEKYGTTPFKIGGEPEVIEKEVVKVITATTEVEIIKEVPVEIEVIKEVEKIVEVTVTDNELIDKLDLEKNQLNKKIKGLNEEIKVLEKNIKEEKEKVDELSNTDAGVIKSLKKEIKNLKTEIELEKNRNYQQPKREKPKEDKRNLKFGNIISWVSKNERKEDDGEDIYGEN